MLVQACQTENESYATAGDLNNGIKVYASIYSSIFDQYWPITNYYRKSTATIQTARSKTLEKLA
jgi:hypothetical protein